MSKYKVLMADTSKANLKVLASFLNKDFEVHFVYDGEQVIEKYYELKPDLILLDINLPKMNGISVVDYLRNSVNDQDTYIITFVADDNDKLKVKVLSVGANDILSKPFTKDELKARIQVAKRQIVLLENLRRAYKRINREMDLVSSLQSKLLPKESFHFPKIGLQSYYRPSGQASGDYYDYIKVSEDILRFCVADVSGHGARAAFIMAIVRTIFRLEKNEQYSLSRLVDLINKSLIEIVGDESDFVTFFIGELNLKDKTFSYINAGHCPAVIRIDKEINYLKPDYPVLGFFPIDPQQITVGYKNDFAIFLYTDGFYEWDFEDGDQLGLERFLDFVTKHFKGEKIYLEEIIFGLDKLGDFSPMYRDDLTALLVYNKKE